MGGGPFYLTVPLPEVPKGENLSQTVTPDSIQDLSSIRAAGTWAVG